MKQEPENALKVISVQQVQALRMAIHVLQVLTQVAKDLRLRLNARIVQQVLIVLKLQPRLLHVLPEHSTQLQRKH